MVTLWSRSDHALVTVVQNLRIFEGILPRHSPDGPHSVRTTLTKITDLQSQRAHFQAARKLHHPHHLPANMAESKAKQRLASTDCTKIAAFCV